MTHTSRPFDWYQIAVLGLALFSFFMAGLVSRTVFERLPHLEDELAYLFQARIFAAGDIVADIPDPSAAYWQPFIITYQETGARFGKYTPGWPAMLSLGLLVGMPWVINAFATALTVTLVYRLGREVFHPQAGLFAAVLTAFSPMALLLNGTLMGHTTALLLATGFIYAYWRLDARNGGLRWGLAAGAALGLLAINRPLSAIAVSAPFIVWSGLRLVRGVIDDLARLQTQPITLKRTRNILAPLLILSAVTLTIGAAIPLFNYVATGDAGTNLYRLVWDYDRVGFGEGYGRNGHTIVKGVAHARYDLSLTAADLFGWTVERDDDAVLGWRSADVSPDVQRHLQRRSAYYPLVGLSFFAIIIGLWVGLKRWWLRLLLIAAVVWFAFPLVTSADFLRGMAVPPTYALFLEPVSAFSTATAVKAMPFYAPLWWWLGIGTALIALPGIWFASKTPSDEPSRWTWLLLTVAASVILAHLAYWVGSQRYSTRYYFEALTALALLGALPFAWLARTVPGNLRLTVYGGFIALMLWSLYNYSTPRIEALYRFNRVSPLMIEQIEARRVDDRPILVIATNAPGTRFAWRGYGSLMAITGPYLDGDLIVARDYAPNSNVRQLIIEAHPGRQVIDIVTDFEQAWFPDCAPPGSETIPPSCYLNPE
ncbi:MAG: glycosyltransferase family 39 protein [Chloroflexota bacterium]